MTAIILFRYDKNLPVVLNKLILLKHFNPMMKIYGLYGGEEDDYGLTHITQDLLENIYIVKDKSPHWKWQNGDLTIRSWFIHYGYTIAFDRVYIIEWDVLALKPLDELYGFPDDNTVIFTGLKRINTYVFNTWYWTTGKNRKGIKKLLRYAKVTYNFSRLPYRCGFPTLSIPRSLLEIYGKTYIPEYGNDEVRFPLFSEIFGYELTSNTFLPKTPNGYLKFFNYDNTEIKTETIIVQMRKAKGRRVFHPYREILDISAIHKTHKRNIRSTVKALAVGLLQS